MRAVSLYVQETSGGRQKCAIALGKRSSSACRDAASSVRAGRWRAPAFRFCWVSQQAPQRSTSESKDRSKFLIASSADAGRAASVSTTASKAKTAAKKAATVAGAVAHKGQRKGPQPAKYLDPKTGATWSERGPAPAWLAAAKDRTKFLIDGAGAVATETSSASKASKAKSSTASGTGAKKAVAKKVAAKKAIAKKAAPAGKVAPATKLASGTGSTT